MNLLALKKQCSAYLNESRKEWVADFLSRQSARPCDDLMDQVDRLSFFLEQHDRKHWYQRLWSILTQPIGRLRQFHAVSLLLKEIELHEPTTTYPQRVSSATVQAKAHFWFFSTMARCLRAAQIDINATHLKNNEPIGRPSKMLTAERIMKRNKSVSISSSQPTFTGLSFESEIKATMEQACCDLQRLGRGLIWTFPPKYKSTLADEWGLITEGDCVKHQRHLAEAALLNNAGGLRSGYLGRLDSTAPDNEYEIVYYRSLQLQLKACISALDAKNNEKTLVELITLFRLLKDGTMIADKKRVKPTWTGIYLSLLTSLYDMVVVHGPNWLTSQLPAVVSTIRIDSPVRINHDEDNGLDDMLQLAQQAYQESVQRQQDLMQHYPLTTFGRCQVKQPALAEYIKQIDANIEVLKATIHQLGCSGSRLVKPEQDISEDQLPSFELSIKAIHQLIIDQQDTYKRVYTDRVLPYITSERDRQACRTLSLDLNNPISWSMVRKAYKNKAAACHPDKGSFSEQEIRHARFLEITLAYDTLEALFDRQDSEVLGLSTDDGETSEWHKRMKAEINELREGFKQDWLDRRKKQDECNAEMTKATEECRQRMAADFTKEREASQRSKDKMAAEAQRRMDEIKAEAQRVSCEMEAESQRKKDKRTAEAQQRIDEIRAESQRKMDETNAKFQRDMLDIEAYEAETEKTVATHETELKAPCAAIEASNTELNQDVKKFGHLTAHVESTIGEDDFVINEANRDSFGLS